jgi:hypothetical protein
MSANASPVPSEISEFSAAVGVFTRPTPTFSSLQKRPTWWLPFVAGLLLSAFFGFFMTDKVDSNASMRQAIEKRSARSGRTMSAADMDKAVDSAVEMQRKMQPFYPVMGAVGFAFFFFLVAGVLALAGNAFGAETKFASYLALYSYAQIPMVLQSIYKTIRLLMIPDGSVTYDQLARVGTVSPAIFFPISATGPSLSFALSLDLFVIASIVLLVLAFRVIPGLSRRAATAIPVALWGVFVLLRVGWAALFG